MIKLSGVLIGLYASNYANKETGEQIHKDRAQVMTVLQTKGGKKSVLHDITIPAEKVSKYKGMEGKEVEIEVSYFGQKITFFGI